MKPETKALRRLLRKIGFRNEEVRQYFRGAGSDGVTFIEAEALARHRGTETQANFDEEVNCGNIATPYNHDDGLTVVFTDQGRRNYLEA